jgi:hypothetical protein
MEVLPMKYVWENYVGILAIKSEANNLKLNYETYLIYNLKPCVLLR